MTEEECLISYSSFKDECDDSYERNLEMIADEWLNCINQACIEP